MDRTDDSSSGEYDSREDAARRLVQMLLLDPEELRRESLADFAANNAQSNAQGSDAPNAGSWAQALSALVARMSRLEQLECEFDQTLLRDKLASMRELAYGASHEINNPLANISSRAQTLLRDETDPERRRKLATINSQAFRAYEMISDMMLFAKPPDLTRESVNLSELIAQVVEELSGQADEQGTAMLVQGTIADCWLSADATHLAVALNALCRNSLEAISAGGQVTISLIKNDTSVELSVTDTGPGIPEEVRRHLFDPFYSGREAGRGLGFGLSKCWRIVELHGGSIEVSGNDREHTCFTIRLPRLAEPMTKASPPLVA
ncbi:MAG: HAMP domain-containing sensor histidine kinase [Planctomycetota bacterium]|nr:HAMP domain-containing sensor histidine kinase [Planctomycetota bacterium]